MRHTATVTSIRFQRSVAVRAPMHLPLARGHLNLMPTPDRLSGQAASHDRRQKGAVGHATAYRLHFKELYRSRAPGVRLQIERRRNIMFISALNSDSVSVYIFIHLHALHSDICMGIDIRVSTCHPKS